MADSEPDTLTAVADNGQDTLTAVADSGQDTLTSVADSGQDTLTSVADSGQDTLTSVADSGQDTLTTVADSGQDILTQSTAVADSEPENLTAVADSGPDILTAMADSEQDILTQSTVMADSEPDTLTAVADNGQDTLTAVADSGQDTLTSVADSGQDTLTSVADSGQDTLTTVADSGQDILTQSTAVADSEPENLTAVADSGPDILTAMADSEPDTLTAVADSGQDILTAVADSGQNTLTSEADSGQNTLSAMADSGQDILTQSTAMADSVKDTHTLGKRKRRPRSNSVSSPDKRSRMGAQLLHYASTGNLEALKSHHQMNGGMSFADYDSRTALHVATAEGHMHVVKYLLEKCKVNPNLQDRWGNTPCDEARRTDNQPIAQLISANVNKKNTSKPDSEVPVELKDRPDLATEYMEALDEGEEIHNTIRIMVVGHFGVGKTSLTRNMLDMSLEGLEQTNGIDVHEHKRSAREDGVWELEADFDLDKNAFLRIAKVVPETSKSEPQALASRSDLRDKPGAQEMLADDLDISHIADAQPVASGKSNFAVLPENVTKYSDAKMSVNKKMTLPVSIWDFGGHRIFNATHQLFHTPRAVYLLVLNMKKDLKELATDEDCPHGSRDKSRTVESCCKFWMHSMSSFVGTQNGEPPVILVGTHRDELEDDSDEFIFDFFDKVRGIFPGYIQKHIQEKTFALNNKNIDRSALEGLRKYIVEVAMEQTNAWNVPSPAKWIPLENKLLKQKYQKHITFDEVCEIDQSNECPIGNRDDIRSFLSIQHLKGTLIYFNEKDLDGFVILCQQLIIDAFKQTITSEKFCTVSAERRPLWNELDSDGVLRPKLIDAVWKNADGNDFIQNKEMLLKYMAKLGILAKLKEYDEETGDIVQYDSYFVPSLMQAKCDYDLGKIRKMKNITPPLIFTFQNDCVSPTLFHRLTAAILARWPVLTLEGKRRLYGDTGIYQMDEKHMFMLRRLEEAIEIVVIGITNEPVAVVQSSCLRRYVEMVLQHELRKYRQEQDSSRDRLPYCIKTRCNKTEKCGTRAIELSDTKEIMCLDTLDHMIDVDHVKRQWYLDKDVVRRRLSDCTSEALLTEHDLSRLSTAIGKNWQMLGLELHVPQAQIDHSELDHRYTQQKIYSMLNVWRTQQKGKITLSEFLKAVEKTEGDVNITFDVVENIKDSFMI